MKSINHGCQRFNSQMKMTIQFIWLSFVWLWGLNNKDELKTLEKAKLYEKGMWTSKILNTWKWECWSSIKTISCNLCFSWKNLVDDSYPRPHRRTKNSSAEVQAFKTFRCSIMDLNVVWWSFCYRRYVQYMRNLHWVYINLPIPSGTIACWDLLER